MTTKPGAREAAIQRHIDGLHEDELPDAFDQTLWFLWAEDDEVREGSATGDEPERRNEMSDEENEIEARDVEAVQRLANLLVGLTGIDRSAAVQALATAYNHGRADGMNEVLSVTRGIVERGAANR